MPLPDGATLITFADVTDSKRYERALVERNDALVAADRLKNAVHRPRLLRAAHAAHQHHRLQRAAGQPAHRGAQRQAARVPRRHLGLVEDAARHHRRHSRLWRPSTPARIELKLGRVDVQAVIDAAILGVRERGPARTPDARHRRRRRRHAAHRRRGARAPGALQSALQRGRLLQAGRHGRHHRAGAKAA